MATVASMTFPRMMKTLREIGNIKEKREVLTYITSQAKKLESSGTIKEEKYKELCRMIIEVISKHEGSIQNDALSALSAIVREFQAHPINLFEAMLSTDRRTRVKILKLLEVVDDNAISSASKDGQALNFFKDCMLSVQPNFMHWITSSACNDSMQILIEAEQQQLSDEEKLEEDTISYSVILLNRLYKLVATTFDSHLKIQRFDTLLLDKIVTLAYMGHKRQRSSALKVLQQAVAINSSLRIRKEYPDLWTKYKENLQSIYCKRMSLLVEACDPDWTIQWNTTIQFLGTDLHRGASLINNLLSVEEKAFKSIDPIVRRQAFLSWKLLIDNFALDHQELANARRIKLLCIPLNAKNSKTELIALTKLEVWWHLIVKLNKDISKFATSILPHFLNFCFGPLGDTPLLSSKTDVVPSPGKRFFKTRAVVVDALHQLVVTKEDNPICATILEEKLPNAISVAVFQDCSKSIIHSIGEALLILGSLTDNGMKNCLQLGKQMWASLVKYIKESTLKSKDHLYKDVILVVIELANYISVPIVKDMFFDIILPCVCNLIEDAEFHDNVLQELVLKLLSLPILENAPEYLMRNDDSIKCLLKRCISPEFVYSYNVFGFLEIIMENLKSGGNAHKNIVFYAKLWIIIVEALITYLKRSKANGKEYMNVQSILSFPFQYAYLKNSVQLQEYVIMWKALYKQLESQSDSISTVKPNEILLYSANMMRDSLKTNKHCCCLIVNCLDTLLCTLDYESLLSQDEIPSILLLILDVVTISFNYIQSQNAEVALKSLSAMLITVYGLNPQKAVLYLHSCKSVVELIFASQIKDLFKEVANTWEYIVNIFKGLNKRLNYELLSSYKQAIIMGMDHVNSNIRSLTQSIFEIKDGLDSAAKCILDEIRKTKEKSVSHSKSDSVTKKAETEESKEIRMAGSFLNRKSSVKLMLKPLSNKPEKNDKNTLIPEPEPDSQDYVYIKTDLKFDVNRLTEHQKETLKRKRDDIPALYNDLSQSSSQNSQNLQEWFDIKAKCINESDKTSNKKSDFCVAQKSIEIEKVKVAQAEFFKTLDKIDHMYSKKSEENIVIAKQIFSGSKSLVEEVEKKSEEKQDQNMDIKRIDSTSHVATSSRQDAASEADEETDVVNIASVAKKLNFESREEFPESKTHERQSSPSMLDNNKRRQRTSMARSNSSLRSVDEAVESDKDANASNVQRMSRAKVAQEKPDASNKQKSVDDFDIKDSNEKKGVKRKYVSDTESDGIARRKRKLLIADDGGETSRVSDVFPDINMDNVSQRTKNEISRLKIDMVFDCHSSNRRRVKHSDEEKETHAHGLRKYGTHDNKNFKLKSVDARSVEALKKSSPKLLERSTKDADDADQGTSKRRGRRSTKPDSSKNDLDVNKEVRKSDDTADKVPESKSSMDVDTASVVSTSSQAVQDVTISRTQNEKLDKEISKANSNVEPLELNQASGQNHNEIEDIVESSQISTVGSKFDKKCAEKQCFIKINKMTTAIKTPDTTVEKDYVPESIPMDCDDNDVPDPCEQLAEANPNNNTEMNDEGNKDNAKDSVQETDNSNTKTLIPEGQKAADNTLTLKSTGVISFSSPKGGGKVFSKPKSFTGRAAHMLGLVTKQSRIEGDSSSITLEDESLVKKSKTKDAESETSLSKKISTVREVDKIGGPSGSRQEKIFSNMRSHDYSVSTNAFATLKNDGEKLSFKLDKSSSDLSTELSVDKENEQDSLFAYEKDDLPILEWSSANPPSLTASPSASILKRHRSSTLESDSDLTPNKRKRVSFADPPVSKEMGYEISTTDSPKTNKYSMARNVMSRKDSSPKFKQTKLKLVSTDTEKLTTENDAQNESDGEEVEVEKRNELLEKISEVYSNVYSEPMDVDEPGDAPESDNIVEANSRTEVTVINELELVQEIVIIAPHEDQQLLLSKDSQNFANTAPIDCVGTQESETQQDIFDGTNNATSIQTSKDNINVSIDNSNDAIKLNVTDDSVIAALPTKDPTNMEDTVDIQNVTGLNSTDEIFCGKPIRTSTLENVAEQDTQSVTDSVFSSLPSLPDTQNQESQNNVEPEYLDSTQSIYPTLSSCVEPLDTIIEQLTYPLWKQNLYKYFATRSMRTIGDLAQLSEREINRLPVKGQPKIEYVKQVLQHFESMKQVNSSDVASNIQEANTQLPTVAAEEPTVSVVPPSNVEAASASNDNQSISCSTPLSCSTGTHDNLPAENSLIENSDKTESVSSDMDISECSTEICAGNVGPPTLGAPVENEQTILIAAQNPSGICTNNIYLPAHSSSFESIVTANAIVHSTVNAIVNTTVNATANATANATVNEVNETKKPSSSNDTNVSSTATKYRRIPRSSLLLLGSSEQTFLRAHENMCTNLSSPKSLPSNVSPTKLLSPNVSSPKPLSSNVPRTCVQEEPLITHSSVGTSTDSSLRPKKGSKATKSVGSQMSLAELLDEIDVNLVLESAVRRCSPEALLSRYKLKMAHLNDTELVKETMRMLDLPNSHKFNEVSLKAAARACGVNKVLLRLPDIFSSDKQFFDKVLNVYSKKLNIADCLSVFDFNKVKSAVSQKCTSSELVEMLSEKLKEEEQEGIKQPMPTLSSLDAMLQRLPMDVIISHTVANEELIPASVVLDIALQNNSSGDIAQALKQSPVLARRVLDKLWTSQFTIAHIDNDEVSKESLLNIFKSVCSKLTAQDLLNAYYEAMTSKFVVKNEKK